MQARVEVEVGFVGRVRPGAEDGSEVAAGGHAESVDEIARRPVVLLLHKNAAAVSQYEGADVDHVSLGVFARDRARLVVANEDKRANLPRARARAYAGLFFADDAPALD